MTKSKLSVRNVFHNANTFSKRKIPRLFLTHVPGFRTSIDRYPTAWDKARAGPRQFCILGMRFNIYVRVTRHTGP